MSKRDIGVNKFQVDEKTRSRRSFLRSFVSTFTAESSERKEETLLLEGRYRLFRRRKERKEHRGGGIIFLAVHVESRRSFGERGRGVQ